jgi:hypothetical protein
MTMPTRSTPSLASAITKSASAQTYWTIRFLVDRGRTEDAFRAYAYFRWVDDFLDAPAASSVGWTESEREQRGQFLARQRSLLDACLRAETPSDANRHESMLLELVNGGAAGEPGLAAYLDCMFRVMDFDVRRRGRLVSAQELDDYSRWLAVAVTEAMHQFIGHGASAPAGEARYAAVTGAHILHMLRDTSADLRAGYYNVPRELLEELGIGPRDVSCDAYRAWVADRVRLARADLELGRRYFSEVGSARHRLAGLAYIARFAWLAGALEHDDFRLRASYAERRSAGRALRMGWQTIDWMARPPRRGRSRPAAAGADGS